MPPSDLVKQYLASRIRRLPGTTSPTPGGLLGRVNPFLGGFVVGVLAGAALTCALLIHYYRSPVREIAIDRVAPPVCYSCFWEGYDSKLRTDLIDFYRQYKSGDPIVMGDVGYILWRATGNPNCDARNVYRQAADDADPNRRLDAYAALGFTGPECGESADRALAAAAEAANQAKRPLEAELLRQIARHELHPRFADANIKVQLAVPPDARSMILGKSVISVEPDTMVGVQVDRVVRDWISYQMRWDFTDRPVQPSLLLPYLEGAFIAQIAKASAVKIYPLAGSIVAKDGGRWLAADGEGVFRFEVDSDKLQYPTTHANSEFAWVLDTHGISALVPQALEHQVPLLVGSGDAPAEAQAAFYLAERGINVVFPGDRFEDMLLGYDAKGVVMGGAPVRQENGRAVIGDQPVRFDLSEPIVAEDTKDDLPVQYYDTPARYFRRLNSFVKVNVQYVDVNGPDEIGLLLRRAQQMKSSAVAVRVATEGEYRELRRWLKASPRNRAILFHSALYPYAKLLFADFRQQVTFGDLRPVFE